MFKATGTRKEKLEEQLYDTAVKDFLYLSEQRLKFIRFYIILIGFFLSAIGFIFYKNYEVNSLALFSSILIESSLIFLTYIFSKIDDRNKSLIEKAKGALKFYETEYLKTLQESPEKNHPLCFLSSDNETEHKN